jgi:hypothetical protein
MKALLSLKKKWVRSLMGSEEKASTGIKALLRLYDMKALLRLYEGSMKALLRLY